MSAKLLHLNEETGGLDVETGAMRCGDWRYEMWRLEV